MHANHFQSSIEACKIWWYRDLMNSNVYWLQCTFSLSLLIPTNLPPFELGYPRLGIEATKARPRTTQRVDGFQDSFYLPKLLFWWFTSLVAINGSQGEGGSAPNFFCSSSDDILPLILNNLIFSYLPPERTFSFHPLSTHASSIFRLWPLQPTVMFSHIFLWTVKSDIRWACIIF